MTETEKLIGVKDLAELTGLPRSWIYQNAETGKIPCFKLGRYVKFRPSEVQAWLEAQRRGGNGKGNERTRTR